MVEVTKRTGERVEGDAGVLARVRRGEDEGEADVAAVAPAPAAVVLPGNPVGAGAMYLTTSPPSLTRVAVEEEAGGECSRISEYAPFPSNRMGGERMPPPPSLLVGVEGWRIFARRESRPPAAMEVVVEVPLLLPPPPPPPVPVVTLLLSPPRLPPPQLLLLLLLPPPPPPMLPVPAPSPPPPLWVLRLSP